MAICDARRREARAVDSAETLANTHCSNAVLSRDATCAQTGHTLLAGAAQPAPKNCGEVFRLLCGPDLRKSLSDVARVSTLAENVLWQLWLKGDPLGAMDIRKAVEQKEASGKWPKIEPFILRAPDGRSTTVIARELCPGLLSYVYDAIANQVSKLYRKHRWDILSCRRRLPVASDLRIRFRERAVQIERDDRRDDWFRVRLFLRPGETLSIPIRTGGASTFTRAWLARLASSGEHPSGGTISCRLRRGKRQWQIAISRAREPGECDEVNPVAGRTLVIYAPTKQDVFLRCLVTPTNGGPPRTWSVESNDLCLVQQQYERRRRSMAANWAQSPTSCAHGHGRKRALLKREEFSARYERRVNSWIEQRSAWLVSEAVRFDCEGLQIENLSARNPESLLVGSFPYHRFVQRIREKAEQAGIDARVFDGIAKLKKLLSADQIGDCE